MPARRVGSTGWQGPGAMPRAAWDLGDSGRETVGQQRSPPLIVPTRRVTPDPITIGTFPASASFSLSERAPPTPRNREMRVKLQEYRSKEILARHGVPLLPGQVAMSPAEARAAAIEMHGPVVVKA